MAESISEPISLRIHILVPGMFCPWEEINYGKSLSTFGRRMERGKRYLVTTGWAHPNLGDVLNLVLCLIRVISSGLSSKKGLNFVCFYSYSCCKIIYWRYPLHHAKFGIGQYPRAAALWPSIRCLAKAQVTWTFSRFSQKYAKRSKHNLSATLAPENFPPMV